MDVDDELTNADVETFLTEMIGKGIVEIAGMDGAGRTLYRMIDREALERWVDERRTAADHTDRKADD